MGIFDSLKNMTNQAVKNNVSKAVSGAVNNAMHKSKTFVFADYPKNADELKKCRSLTFRHLFQQRHLLCLCCLNMMKVRKIQ